MKANWLALMVAGVGAAVSIAGCGGSGGADPRDAVVGVWSGSISRAIYRAGRAGTPVTVTMQLTKGASATGILGSYQMSIVDGANTIVVAFGDMAGTYANNQGTVTLSAHLDANARPLATPLQPAGTLTFQLSAGSRGPGGQLLANLTVEDYPFPIIGAAPLTIGMNLVSGALSSLDMGGTTWNGDPANGQGLAVQIPDVSNPGQTKTLGTFALSLAFDPRSSTGAQKGKITGTLPGGQSFTTSFDTVLLRSTVIIGGYLPADAPAIDLGGGLSLPLAGLPFLYKATVNGNTMGDSSAHFNIQLPSALAALATAFGLTSDDYGYFSFGNATLTKQDTGGIAVPIN